MILIKTLVKMKVKNKESKRILNLSVLKHKFSLLKIEFHQTCTCSYPILFPRRNDFLSNILHIFLKYKLLKWAPHVV